jgi:hypothetical protein
MARSEDHASEYRKLRRRFVRKQRVNFNTTGIGLIFVLHASSAKNKSYFFFINQLPPEGCICASNPHIPTNCRFICQMTDSEATNIDY